MQGLLLREKMLPMSSRDTGSSLWSSASAFSSSSSRELFSAESSELVLSRLELSSGDLERIDIRSMPQCSDGSIESISPLITYWRFITWF